MLRTVFLSLFLFVSAVSFSQYDEENSKDTEKEIKDDEKAMKGERPEWVNNITVGGDFGVYFTGFSGYVGIGPKVGYQVTNWFNPGITLRYSYNYARFNTGQVFSNHTYGTGAFMHFRFFDKLFAGVEYEALNVNQFNSIFAADRVWAHVLFLGVGYSQRLGNIGFINFMLQYDVINDPNSPFRTSYFIGNPVTGQVIPLRYQIGFTFKIGGYN